MPNQETKDIFRKKMENENTPYLERILEIHNTHEWSEEKFEIIADILRLRRESIPLPPQPQYSPQPVTEGKRLVPLTPLLKKLAGLSFRRMRIVIIILFVLCLNIAVLLSPEDAQSKCQARMSNGRTVSATVNGLKRVMGGPGDSPYLDLRVEYSFPAIVNGQQKTVNTGDSITYDLFSSLQVGQTIEVIYDISNPYNNAVKSENRCPIGNAQFLIILDIIVFVFLGFISLPDLILKAIKKVAKKTGTG